jgi:hypothetical protein
MRKEKELNGMSEMRRILPRPGIDNEFEGKEKLAKPSHGVFLFPAR